MLSENLLPIDGELYYFSEVFSASLADKYLQALVDQITWSQLPIQLFGRQVLQPRLTAWCADPEINICYSGVTYQPQQWLPYLREIKTAVEALAGCRFNGVLLNYYRDGQDSMGWHRDNESYLGVEPAIVSVSLGAERTFRLRHRVAASDPVSLELEHGSVLLMRGNSQVYWEHCLPKRKRVNARRVNLTFRYVYKF